MVKAKNIPDAWEDDDWEAQADRAEGSSTPAPETEPALTKTERLARHAETNRKLWESAETSQTFHYLEASNSVPVSTASFRPQVKVLSRKPVLAKRNPSSSGAQTPADEDDEDDDAKKRSQLTPEQIRAKQKRDLEEKQRRYDEARAKIFGESAPSSGASTPGTVTPPRGVDGAHYSPRGRGRGRGGRGNNNNNNGGGNNESRRQNMPPPSSSNRELYDPNYAQRRLDEGPARMSGSTAKDEQAPIRAPRGPDGTGRGGFGFARGRGRGT